MASNSNYNAGPGLLKSLNIREQENDDEGINYCYARLADFYAQKDPNYALRYAIKMYRIAKKNNSPYDQLEALYKLVKLKSIRGIKKLFCSI